MNKPSGNILKGVRHLFLVIFFAMVSLSLCPAETTQENATASPDTKDSGGLVTKTVDGLHFAVPPDMPIEKKNSIVAPMQLSEYVSIKFDNLQDRVAKIEETIDKIYQELVLIKKNLEDISNSSSALLSPEQSNSPSLKDMKEQ